METNDLGEDDDVTDIPKITIGLCAMNKKTRSRPMKEIVTRIVSLGFFDVKIFTDEVILKEPIEKWPLCDCLISFFSSGFPLEKAIAYADLRKPFLLNDLKFQFDLQDRCKVYSLLKSAGIETPRYAILRRDEDGNVIGPDLIETEDSVQIGDTVFYKPFVEKPLDAEDHSVCIYYPTSAGGGSQRLFRKVGSRSSVYSRQSCVRRTGSYIYEDFVPTDGTDVKVYTVGPEYAHAEARKSPSLDGKVERDSQGKEIRYPVILNQYEKEIANKVCTVFKQSVCGFDLLRTRGKSYVCDVNGFSFVKTSRKYYDDCAMVISSIILLELAPQLYMPYNPDYVIEDMPPEEGEYNEDSKLELLCVVGIIRHGDRTPKQKLKMEVRHPRFIELFRNYGGSNEHDLKLKKPKEMQEVLDIARDLLQAIKNGEKLFENRKKLHQIKSVLEMYGYFSGINRKVQLKYLGRVSSGLELQEESQSRDSNRRKESGEIALLLILKWGGELTSMGRAQAEELGETYRWMYTESQDEYTGGGLLRLHSTYRHDLKIYASDEGRVQMTAAAFAKGFLALEGELTPILVHLVRTDKNVTQMLDTSVDAARIMAKVKHHLHEIMQKDEEFKKEDFNELAPTQSRALVNAMKKVRNPHQMCEKLYSLVQALTTQLKEMINDKVIDPKKPYLYHGESLELMTHRWTKLEKDFKLKTGDFDISLIPDLYDCIKYDVQHNRNLGLKNTMELYNCAKSLADIVIPQEYGITKEEKLDISERVCFRLLRKFHGDLKHADKLESTTRLDPKYSRDVGSPHRHVRTRLYFTSESHIHTVTNALRCAKLFDDVPDSQWQRAVNYLEEVSELNYMTQIVFMLYEDPTMDPNSGQKFHLKLHFSSGARTIDDPHYVGSPVKALGDISEDFDPWILSPWGEFVKGPKEDSTAAEEKEAITSSDHSSQNGRINGNTTALMQKNPKACNRNSHETGIDGKFASTSSFCSDDSLYQLINSPNSFTNSLSSLEHFEENVDKPFDENLFGFNEQPRCSIGENMEEYIDSGSEMAPGLGMDDQKHLEGSPRKTCDGSTFKSEISEIKASHTDDSRLFAKSNASIMQQLKQAKLTNFRRTRSKSEGDVLGFFSTRKDEEYQLLREATNFLQGSWNVKEDSSNGTVESTKISESRNIREVANEETKDYFELLQSYTSTRPRRGSEDGPKFEEEVMELMKSKRFKSWPNALSNEEREKEFLAHHGSSQAEDKTRAESPSQSSKAYKVNFSSSDEIKSVQKVRETQPSQPERNLELKHEDDSPPAAPTEKETENGMKESCAPSVKTTEQDLVLSGRTKSALHLQGKQYPQPRVLRTKWSIGGTPITAKTDETISQQMQALQLSPPQGKLRSRWSAGGPPCAAVLSTLQAVRKKSYGVRKISKSRPPPGCFTIPEEKGSPPVSDFWRLIESINPLLVLHDSIPLKQMDKFLETLSKHSPKNTPHSSPHRNKRTKHLLSK